MKKSSMLFIAFSVMVILVGCKKSEPTDDTMVDTTEHSNHFQILPDGFSPSITYSFSGDYSVTEHQPWNGVSSSGYHGGIDILVLAGRKGSHGPADWFTSKVSAAACSDESWSGMPDDLNFAFTGTLTIDGNSYVVVLGQGHPTLTADNDWWIGGSGWILKDNSNQDIYTPDRKYLFSSDASSSDYLFFVSEN